MSFTNANPSSSTSTDTLAGQAYPFKLTSPVNGLPDGYTPEKLRLALLELLGDSQAEVYQRENEGFAAKATVFNGAIKTPAALLVRPTNAQDVSRTIVFCRKRGLEISVKAGGFGVHGWSVAGHVIIDLCNMKDVQVSLPASGPSLMTSFQKLRLDNSSILTVEPTALSNQTGDSSADSSPRLPMSTPTTKRSANEAWSSDEVGGTVDTVLRERKRQSSMRDKGKNKRDESGSSSGDQLSGSISGSSASAHRSESGSSTGTGASHSTQATSVSGGSTREQMLSGLGIPPSSDSLGSPSLSPGGYNNSPLLGRVTYVNPNQAGPSRFAPGVGVNVSIGSIGTGNTGVSDFFRPPSYMSSGHIPANTRASPPPYTLVSFGAGMYSKDLDAVTAASAYGSYHIPCSAYPVGAGQYLTGGFGFLGRKYGLAMDNVVEVEMVLADGRVVWVGENGAHGGDWREGEDPNELWWAVRGSGTAFGVATRYRAKAYYIPTVYAGNFIFPFDKATAPSFLRHVRDCIKGASNDLYANIILTAGPRDLDAIIVIQLCYLGPRSEGEMYVQAIGSWDGGRCLFQDFSERSFERQQDTVKEVLKGGEGRKWYIKSDMLNTLNDEVIEQTVARFHTVPDGCTWLFEFTGASAVADTKDTCFPQIQREASFTVAALHQWNHDEAPADDDQCVISADEWIDQVIHKYSPGGPLPCFLQSDSLEQVRGTFGLTNFARLTKLKKQLDPENFFSHSFWPDEVVPATLSGEAMEMDASAA